MKRREFIALLGASVAVWPLNARAQRSERMRRIGILSAGGGSVPTSPHGGLPERVTPGGLDRRP